MSTQLEKRSKFFLKLEEVLDANFPKGKCKERGPALLLFTEACMLHDQIATQSAEAERERCIERAAKVVYDSFIYEELGEKPYWKEGGNSLMQDEARKIARKALTPTTS